MLERDITILVFEVGNYIWTTYFNVKSLKNTLEIKMCSKNVFRNTKNIPNMR